MYVILILNFLEADIGMNTCTLSCFRCVQLFASLCTAARQAPLCMGLSRQEYWSGSLCPPPGDLPNPGREPASVISPALQTDSLPTELSGKPCYFS